jgi:hypothetical protein
LYSSFKIVAARLKPLEMFSIDFWRIPLPYRLPLKQNELGGQEIVIIK